MRSRHVRRALAATIRLFLLIDLALGSWLISPSATALAQEQATPAAINNDEEIVYIDTFGVIRVIDPVVPSGRPAVQWYSPVGDWEADRVGGLQQRH